MAKRSSGLGSLIVVVGVVAAVGWIVEKLQNPAARTAWLWTGGITFTGYVAYRFARRALRRRSLMQKYGDPQLVARIINSEVWQGQTEEQLRDALGRPADVDEQVMKTKTKRVWKYGRSGKNRYRLRITLENGSVIGWDEKGD